MNGHGKYIVIEGPDGTGKTTQAHLLAEGLSRSGRPSRYVHEPGETRIGIELERILKNPDLARHSETNLLLFTANRFEIYHQVIKPALDNGEIVVSDRNWLSSVVYQGIAAGLGVDTVRSETNKWLPEEYMEPTFTALLFLPEKQHRDMLSVRGTSEQDYFESKPANFQEKLKNGYDEVAQIITQYRHVNGEQLLASARISASGSIENVHARIIQKLELTGVF